MLAMAAEFTQDTILEFLTENGNKVRNADLIEHFRTVFPEEPEKKAVVRDRFKTYVDNVAVVKTESGVKYVCLKKKFRRSLKEKCGKDAAVGEHRYVANPDRGANSWVSGDDAAEEPRAQVHKQTGSGYGSDSQVRVPHVCSTETAEKSHVCIVEDGTSGKMGNRQSFSRKKSETEKDQGGKVADIPVIAVIEASPLPAEGAVFTLPGPALSAAPTQRHAEVVSSEALRDLNSKGSLGRVVSDDKEDARSLSGSEDNNTPKGSRKHFIEVMMNRSPQLRRSLVLRSSVCMPSRSDSDSASMISSITLEDERASVTLDPLEHEWMMCASDGEWGSLHPLLISEPGLVLKKDFITGFTCLHWAAKHGRPELMAMIINFAKQNNVPFSVDVRSNSGYTPLHVAAMHGHMEVVKLLVGAYNADVEIRDYSGRKACQYLTDSVSVDIRDIIGAYEESENMDRRDGGRWRFSRVLQSNLRPLRLLNASECDSVDGEGRPREKPVRRRSSLSRMKPKLQRLRYRTSQIVQSASFHDKEDVDGSKKGSFRSRPKTHFFG
ncbi:ankyrin repeat domain-containing protein SOWAHC-like [Parambassis ranga]|uniref:Ankyrin repeat domain-containing protein SOWAHC-like n=1 Tax=Parambassis ranga TaxID=210632 RepID=A0A6P7I0X8_9TELE|nr:ankyrin repeat domain-containing protein SOWAHC-like [Parambassis ranga]